MKKQFRLGLSDQQRCLNSTGASDGSFYPIFNKRFDHLETLLTIHRTNKVLSAGSLCESLVPSPQSKCPKRTFILPQKYHASVLNCYHSHVNVSQKTKTNIDFMNENWVRPTVKCQIKGYILLHKFHAPNFYRRFWHTLAN